MHGCARRAKLSFHESSKVSIAACIRTSYAGSVHYSAGRAFAHTSGAATEMTENRCPGIFGTVMSLDIEQKSSELHIRCGSHSLSVPMLERQIAVA